jgi:hypothetical protein
MLQDEGGKDKVKISAEQIEVGDQNLQPAVVGDDWKALMSEMLDEICNIIVPTGSGPSGNPFNSPRFMAIKSKLDRALSKHHKVEK